MTNLEMLKKYMKPLYQEESDEELLNDYLTLYHYPCCAAYHLWEQATFEIAYANEGEARVAFGGEKFEYASPSTIRDLCVRQAKYYKELCEALGNSNTGQAIRVGKGTVAGIPYVDTT